VAQRGARLSYEGALNRDTSFFMRLTFNHARDALTGEDIVRCRVLGRVWLHYLNRSGYSSSRCCCCKASVWNDVAAQPNWTDSACSTFAWGKRSGLRSSVFVELNNILNSEYSVLRDRQPGRELRIGALHRF
jgi:hypothetical protein